MQITLNPFPSWRYGQAAGVIKRPGSNIPTPDETSYACQMARPLRLEFSGAVYHVTSRGDRREEILLNDADRSDWLEVLGVVCARFNWVV